VEAAPDPYAAHNADNLRRLSAAGWVAGLAVVAAIAPFAPPTAAIGAWGWAVWALIAVVTLGSLAWLARHPHHATYDLLLATNYFAAASLALDQWLSGGWRAPYHEILVLIVLVGALGHPARRFAPLGACVALVALLPLAYDSDHGALLGVVADLGLWCGLAAFCLILMRRVRAQRMATERLAQIDPLTGLGNRRAFEAQAAAALAGPVALAVGDVDAFKAVNDEYGHLAGDACLTQAAAALAARARSQDAVFRWGGDEFAVLLRGAGAEDAAAAAARLEAAVAEAVRRPDTDRLTMTFGWAVHRPGMDVDALVAAADADLLRRKAARRAVSLA
jgi:diguanylate cyclase (GGDEF)-like protein